MRKEKGLSGFASHITAIEDGLRNKKITPKELKKLNQRLAKLQGKILREIISEGKV